jgi:hypothetical protein
MQKLPVKLINQHRKVSTLKNYLNIFSCLTNTAGVDYFKKLDVDFSLNPIIYGFDFDITHLRSNPYRPTKMDNV